MPATAGLRDKVVLAVGENKPEAKAALEEQNIRTLLKKHKNNSSGDSRNINPKKAKKTLLPGNTPTNGAGSMNEDEPVDKNRPVNSTIASMSKVDFYANGKEKVMYSNYQNSKMVDEVELLNE
ncbi:hypothetical protein BDR06DRAFT_977698, partial [Suillus hirtellus]